jgi:hypothetical protein
MDQTKTKIAPCFSLEAEEVRQKTERYTTHVYLSCVDGIDLTSGTFQEICPQSTWKEWFLLLRFLIGLFLVSLLKRRIISAIC